MIDRYNKMLNNMILRLNEQGLSSPIIAELTGCDVDKIDECINWFESAHDHELNIFMDQIKEEFFDNRIRAYKLTKMGLIDLTPYIQPGKLLDFYKKLKHDSIVIELKE